MHTDHLGNHMRIRHLLATAAVAAMTLGVAAGPASADHTKGKKYLDVELTRDAAIEAGDDFGAAPEGTRGSGALYVNHGRQIFQPWQSIDLEAKAEDFVAERLAHLEVPDTTRLLDAGPTRIAQKLGEEGVEAALAGASGSEAELAGEAADLVYHLLVLLRSRGVALADVVGELQRRHGD